MRRLMVFFTLLMFSSFLIVGCSGTKTQKIDPEPANPGEKLLWSTSDVRPQWTYKSPENNGSDLTIVGISDNYSMEKYAREDAIWDAKVKTIEYVNSNIRSFLSNKTTQEGRVSETRNPRRIQSEFETRVSNGQLNEFRVTSLYMEKWKDQSGDIYWKAYVRAEVDENEITRILEQIQNEPTQTQ
jgi:hypothetical protein